MKLSSRIISLLLAILTAASLFAMTACGDSGKQDETTVAVNSGDNADESTGETGPVFPVADYGGAEFGVYIRNSTATHYPSRYIFCPENATDLVNEQAAIRNAIVEEKYNIKFKIIETENPNTTMKTDNAGGYIPYAVVLDQRHKLRTAAYDGVLRNFHELDIDYTTSWWDANAAKEYSYKGKLFIMPNDASVSNISAARFMFFNKAVLEDFNLTSPYEYVAQNNWTIDTFFTMVKSVSAPGPEGQIGVYGLANESGNVRNFMLTSIGVFSVELDDEQNLICKIATDYAERTQDFFDKLRVVVDDSNVCIDFETADKLDAANASKYPDKYYHTRALFSQGHFLFTQTSMGGTSHFEEMEKGFGLVMNPKYNSDQENYYHKIDPSAVIWALPKDPAADLTMVANVFDFWAYTSSSTVMEAFYELTMKTKRASDPTAAEMLDTVKATIKYYITDIFSASVNDYISAAYGSSVIKAWRTYSTKLPKSLLEVQQAIEAIE